MTRRSEKRGKCIAWKERRGERANVLVKADRTNSFMIRFSSGDRTWKCEFSNATRRSVVRSGRERNVACIDR